MTFFYNEPSFSGLFRLLDDFDQYRSSAVNQQQQQQEQQITSGPNFNNNGQRQLSSRGGFGGLLGQTGGMLSFTPKFDLRETDTAFELRGDLPGVEKDQVHIEFADEHTLTIRGRVEREWSSKSPSAESEGKKQDTTPTTTTTNDAPVSNGHEKDASSKDKAGDQQQQQQVKKQEKQEQQQAPAKYWITERSVGEFSRSFRLTGHHHHHSHGEQQGAEEVEIDHDGVTAKLENGVLNVVVPKVVKEKKQPRRKVEIH